MVTKYVWWDEVRDSKRRRVDVRMPTPLYDFLHVVAKENAVSVNSLIVGILVYAADAEAGKTLRVEVVSDVRVTDQKADRGTVDVPVPAASLGYTKRWRVPKVR